MKRSLVNDRVRAGWVACAILLLAFVSGCTRLIYNNLDTVAGWYLGSLVTLDTQQRGDLKAALKQTLEWHRDSQLARYAQFLRQLAAELAQPASAATYESARQSLKEFGADLVARMAPDAVHLLTSLSPAQRDQLVSSVEKKSREQAEKELSELTGGSWHAKRAKEIRAQVKRWTGLITAQQTQLVLRGAQSLQPTATDWLASQRNWQDLLREAFSDGDRPPADRVFALFSRPDGHWTAEYRAKSAANGEQILLLLQALDATLTTSQRRHLQRELIELAEELDALKEN
jgi:uncharacterized protein DUF6279